MLGWLHSVAREQVEVALGHPARLIANALGSPPPDVIASAHDRGMLVAALAGKAAHARSHVAAGVDIVVAQGYEAGGHTGEIATMVLVPEVVDAVGPDVPVLAAGGIGSGRQIAAALALGAAGAWMGSAWLVTSEYAALSPLPAVRDALLAASSSDTVRSRVYSGKPARLLKNRWTNAWTEPGAPDPLPMPLQNLLVAGAHQRLMASGNPEVVPMPVGQIIGRMNEVRPVADVVASSWPNWRRQSTGWTGCASRPSRRRSARGADRRARCDGRTPRSCAGRSSASPSARLSSGREKYRPASAR